MAYIYIGKWKSCPEFEYLSVFKTREYQTKAATNTTIVNDIILINLFYEGNKNITFYRTTKKSDALKVAKHLALVFNIDILDATGTENQWIE